MASRAAKIKEIETAMGMSYRQLNKLRDQLMAARKGGDTALLAQIKARIDAAHQAKADYVAANELNPYTLAPAPEAYARMRAAN